MSPDWTVLDVDGVQDEITKQAASVAAMFETFQTAEDLEQEAMIHCAMNPKWVRDCKEMGKGYFGVALWRVLRDKVRTEAARQSNVIGIHRLYESAE